MLGSVVMGFLAAFGAVCLVWTVCSMFLPSWQGAVVVYICSGGKSYDALVSCHNVLRGLGFVKARLLLVDCPVSSQERQILTKRYPYLDFCSLQELSSRLEWERTGFE